MKLPAWNAAMRFRDKIKHVLPLDPDILVIPECEAPQKWPKGHLEHQIGSFIWEGKNPNKGLGIITLNPEYSLNIHPMYIRAFKYVVPIEVQGPQEFILFAIWSQNTQNQYNSYIGQIYLAVRHYLNLLTKPCVLMGDWNSHPSFDGIKRVGTHTDVNQLLGQYRIFSTYHHYFNETQGEESRPTYYFRKEHHKPFHIDYIFASSHFLRRLNSVEVGQYNHWINYSDHMPLLAEFNLQE